MRQLTVKKLMKFLSEFEEDAVVLIPSDEHMYRYPYLQYTTALEENSSYGIYTEDHGEEFTPESEYGKRVSAVVIS